MLARARPAAGPSTGHLHILQGAEVQRLRRTMSWDRQLNDWVQCTVHPHVQALLTRKGGSSTDGDLEVCMATVANAILSPDSS